MNKKTKKTLSLLLSLVLLLSLFPALGVTAWADYTCPYCGGPLDDRGDGTYHCSDHRFFSVNGGGDPVQMICPNCYSPDISYDENESKWYCTSCMVEFEQPAAAATPKPATTPKPAATPTPAPAAYAADNTGGGTGSAGGGNSGAGSSQTGDDSRDQETAGNWDGEDPAPAEDQGGQPPENGQTSTDQENTEAPPEDENWGAIYPIG